MSRTPNPDNLDLQDLRRFILEQYNEWDLFSDNFSEFTDSEKNEREITLEAPLWFVTISTLAYRKASATADIDKALAGERPCFLCDANRPREQRSIDRLGYKILANPYPLGALHLTIVSPDHRPQLIAGSIRDMVRMTRVLPDLAIFYNGPRCGASAPDHQHFQGVIKPMMDNFYARGSMLLPLAREGKSTLSYAVRHLAPFPYFQIQSAKDSELLPLFKRVMDALPGGDPEPMVNIVAWKAERGTTVIIIPRRAHRPECYGAGEGKLLVSPATLEMAGFFRVTREADNEALTPEKVQAIYDDVCLSNEDMETIVNRIRK